MSSSADPQLLSLLQKISNPIENVNIKIDVKGIFAPPEQWKLTDQANPNVFGYTLEFLDRKFVSGKIHPKTGTQPATQNDKGKKGAKKQVVKEEQKPPVEEDPQKIRLKAEWDALPEDEKFRRTSEDQEKMFSLKFPQNQISELLTGQSISAFEQSVQAGQVKVVLTRKPILTEQQMAKLKKSKPKNLNLGQLYEAKYTGILNLNTLQTPGQTSVSQRLDLQLSGDIPAEFVRIEAGKCYAFIQISLDKSLLPKVTEIKPQLSQVLPTIENLSPKSIDIIQKLKRQIQKTIKAISNQYATFFSKQKQFPVDDKKNTGLNSISTLRMNEINKRKDIFLTEFVNSGKFNIIKLRIGQSIKAVIIDKFRKQKQSGPISQQQIHKTLSQLNLFFHEFIRKVIDHELEKENSGIHDDIVLTHEATKGVRNQSIALVKNESKEQVEQRIAEEYQTVNDLEKTEERLLNLILLNNQSIESLEKYAIFCCKNKKFDAAYAIYRRIVKQVNNHRFKLILSIFMIKRKRIRQAHQMLSQLIEDSQSTVDQKILYNNLLSFMYEVEGQVLLFEKHWQLAEKYFQIKKNPYLKINPPHNPYLEARPLIPGPERYTSQLTASQSQEMLADFITVLEENLFYDLIGKLLTKCEQSQRKQILTIKVHLFHDDHEKALELLDEMLDKDPKNIDLLQMKADICYKYDKIFESQEVFMLILRLKKKNSQAQKAYLRLAYIYLNRKSWEDAKNTFEKVCEIKVNSSLGWLGLGKALLQLNQLQQAQEAFSMSSIYNPLSPEPQNCLQRINKLRKQENEANYKYLEGSGY